MFAFVLSVLLLGFPEPQTDPCARPADCRTVAFEVRVGGQSYPFTRPGPQPWVTEGRLVIFPGESVVVAITDDGGLSVVSSEPAAAILTDPVVGALTGVFAPGGEGAGATEDQVVPSSSVPKLTETSAKTVRVTFRQAIASDDMLLVIQNGYGDPMIYNAGMLVRGRDGGQWAATTVCTVLPDIYAFEHWPHPIYALSLGGFDLDATAPRDSVSCG